MVLGTGEFIKEDPDSWEDRETTKKYTQCPVMSARKENETEEECNFMSKHQRRLCGNMEFVLNTQTLCL
jgi:hypothetical protein